MSKNKYNVVCAPVGATTNYAKVVNGILYLGNGATNIIPVCKMSDTSNWKKTVAAATVAQVGDVVFVGTANSTVYSFWYKEYNKNTQEWVSHYIHYTTPASGTVSATTIGAAIAALINGNSQIHATAVNASGTVTITAVSDYPVYKIIVDEAGGGITVSSPSTAGVVGYGMSPYVALTNAGISPDDIPSSTSGYTGYTFEYNVPYQGENNMSVEACLDGSLFINTDATGAAGLISAVDLLIA